MPGIRFEIVVVVPVPATDPGLMVQVPVAGRPLSTTLPVGAAQEEGWVSVPTIGAGGASGAGFILTLADGSEVHPSSLVTLKL